jgi:hypothetical protein
MANQSAANTVALRGRVDSDDAYLADPPCRVNDPRSRKARRAAIDLCHPRRCHVGIEDLAHLCRVVLPPVLAVEEFRQFGTEDPVDRGEDGLPGA